MDDDSALLSREAVRSALLWWDGAGVDLCVDDAPFPWLAEPVVAVAPVHGSEAPPLDHRAARAAAPVAAPRPQTLDALLAHLLSDPDLAEAGPVQRRIAASGDPSAALMVMIDTPDEGDAERGALLTGESARLFDAMLAAIGRTRADCYLVALCPGVPPGGLLPPAAVTRFAGYARDHVAWAGAETVWLLGSAAIRAILEADALPLPKGLQLFNHLGRKRAVVAGHAPRVLLRQPRFKGQVWAEMQALRIGKTL